MQLGDSLNQQVKCDNAEVFGPFGLVSVPPLGSPDGMAPDVLHLERGDQDTVIGGRDARGQAFGGQLSPGETCLYAPGPACTGNGRVVLRDDGEANGSQVTMMTTVDNIKGSEGGKMVAVSVDSTGAVDVRNQKAVFRVEPNGDIFLQNDGCLIRFGNDGKIRFEAGEISFMANSVLMGGGGAPLPVLCGAPPGVPSTCVAACT
jgi:hypothetical protein